MQKWIAASLGKLKVEDHDVMHWLTKRNMPMVNYVLLKGNKSQILRVLSFSIEKDIYLRLRLVRHLSKSNDSEIATMAAKSLQVKRPIWLWM